MANIPLARKLAVLLAALLALVGRANCQPSLAWACYYSDQFYCFSDDIRVDQQGNVYVVGSDEEPNSATQIILMKFDAGGTIQWFKTYLGSYDATNSARMMLDHAGNIYVAGESKIGNDHDALLVKFDSYGNLLWKNSYADADHLSDYFTDIGIDSQNNVIVGGTTQSTATGQDYLIRKIDPSGNVFWTKTYNTGSGSTLDEFKQLKINSQDEVNACGLSSVGSHYAQLVQFSPSGVLNWSTSSLVGTVLDNAGPCIDLGLNDHLLMAYNTNGGAAHEAEYYRSGLRIWDTGIPGYQVTSCCTDPAGYSYLTGAHSTHQFAARLSSAGTILWTVDDNTAFTGASIVSSNGAAYILNKSEQSGMELPAISKVSDAGAILWDAQYPNHPTEPYFATAFAVRPSGVIDVTGWGHSGMFLTESFFETPTAVPDTYHSSRNTTLTVNAGAGVLANDVFGEGGTVVLTSDVSNGTLTLNSDGGFTYKPSQGFIGKDTFTYRMYKGPTQSNVATVSLFVDPNLTGLTLNPSTVVGGDPTTGTATLDAQAPVGGTTVSLSASSQVIVPPPYVLVPAGTSSAQFVANTLAVGATYVRTITANLNGKSKVASLTLLPKSSLTGLSVSPNPVIGGLDTTGTVTISAPAPPGGITVALSDNSAALTTPPSVTVPQGATSAVFTIGTAAVATQATRIVTASYSGVTKNANVTLLPGTALVSLTLNPTTVVGGNPTQGKVTLVNPAPPGGVVVALSANSSVITVPASVTVPAGAKTATFTATTKAVGQTYVRTISASYQAVTKVADLTITP